MRRPRPARSKVGDTVTHHHHRRAAATSPSSASPTFAGGDSLGWRHVRPVRAGHRAGVPARRQPPSSTRSSCRGDGSVERPRKLADRDQRALADPEVEVLTGAEITKETQSAIEESLSFLTLFLTIFAAIRCSSAASSSTTCSASAPPSAPRRTPCCVPSAPAVHRSPVRCSSRRSWSASAARSSAASAASGWRGSSSAGLNAAGFGPGDTSLTIRPTGFIITMIVGVLVTLVCAIAPAIRSGRVPPLAAMRDVAIDRAAMSTGRKVLGGLSLLVAVAAIGGRLEGRGDLARSGCGGDVPGAHRLGPFVASPIAKLTAPLLGRLRGASGTMAGRNAARNPKRTALTAGALAVGLSLVIGVATLGSSAKASIREILGESFESDYIVTPKQQQRAASAALRHDRPEVKAPVWATSWACPPRLFQRGGEGRHQGQVRHRRRPRRCPGSASRSTSSRAAFDRSPPTVCCSRRQGRRDGLAVGDR